MTIEIVSTQPSPDKSAQSTASGKGKTGNSQAGNSAGFLAMLSAADDALNLTADASSLVDPAGGLSADPGLPQPKDQTAYDEQAAVLAGWVLGVPAAAVQVPTAGEAIASAQSTGLERPGRTVVATDAAPTSALQGVARKVDKAPATALLQKMQGEQGVAQAQVQEQEQGAPKALEMPLPEFHEKAMAALSLESKEVKPAATLAAMVERRSVEPVSAKTASADVTYFQPQGASAPMGMDGVVANQSASSVESYVAEQITYWISHDVQNAELSLDGLGASPVEVSISMQGNEAQVAFRTDELQARDAIENASQHLKDLLQRQGVVLTGMSVGTSLAGDASDQGQRQRQEGKQAVVTALVPLPTNEAARARVPQGRALDLFV